MSNVRPLVLLRGTVTLPSSLRCFGSASSSHASARPLALPFQDGLSGPSFVIAARERSLQRHAVFCGQLGASGRGLREPTQSLGLGSAGPESSSVQARSAQQFSERPNPSIERTRKGKARYAHSSFSASRALPSRASHVKR